MRKIIHIDMDCFYAAVEMRDNPAYRALPLAVGGEGARSVLCTCNYIARQFGVRAAMPALTAKQLCPQLLIVPVRMSVYQAVSKQIRAIFARYTQIIEPLSLDEAYLDVTDCTLLQGSATRIAQQIRQDIEHELQLTASAGIAPNKFLAKIASDEQKPNGQCVISPTAINAFVEHLPLTKIPGIGPKTAEKLALHGFRTCADVRATKVEQLLPLVGKYAQVLLERSHGRDDRAIVANRIRKSLAIETTLAQDICDNHTCVALIEQLVIKLQSRFAKLEGYHIIKQGIKLKFADFSQTTVEQTIAGFDGDLFLSLLPTAVQRGRQKPIRLIGLSLGLSKEPITAAPVSTLTQLCLPFDG
jgi:DNA polymerase IV